MPARVPSDVPWPCTVRIVGEVDDVVEHYEGVREEHRISEGFGRLELQRTREIVSRYLPAPPATVLDVGGGTGVHAAWLAEAGYQPHVVDLTPRRSEERRVGKAWRSRRAVT